METLEDRLNFLLKYRINFLVSTLFSKNELKNKRILFYPRLPHHRTILYKICKELGLKIINNPEEEFDILFAWQDATFSERVNMESSKKYSAINLYCLDISKEKVDLTFEKIFGYGLTINPHDDSGECVVKSNMNARHDGKIIVCPVTEKHENVVYQKVIDNTIDEEFVRDIRVPVFGQSIPLVYHKFKKMVDRFTNDINHVEVHETHNILSKEEIEKIIRFASEMKLDYGELDILRHKKDGKIYIVDVNKTPWGPPATISREKAKYVIKKMTDAFAENFLNNST